MVWPVPVSNTGVGWVNRELALARKSVLQPALWQYPGVGKKMLRKIHLLIPTRTSTTYFHEYIYPYTEIHFIKGRLKFRDLTGVSKKPTSAPFPSIMCIYKHAWEMPMGLAGGCLSRGVWLQRCWVAVYRFETSLPPYEWLQAVRGCYPWLNIFLS